MTYEGVRISSYINGQSYAVLLAVFASFILINPIQSNTQSLYPKKTPFTTSKNPIPYKHNTHITMSGHVEHNGDRFEEGKINSHDTHDSSKFPIYTSYSPNNY